MLPIKGLCLLLGFLIAPLFQIATASSFTPFNALLVASLSCLFSFVIGIGYCWHYRGDKLKAAPKTGRMRERDGERKALSPLKPSERMMVLSSVNVQ